MPATKTGHTPTPTVRCWRRPGSKGVPARRIAGQASDASAGLRLKFWDLVGRRRQAGRSVLIISHFVTDQERFDRIVELRDGRAVAQ